MANTEDYLDSLLNSINNTNMSGKKSKSYSGSDPYDNASEAFRKFEREGKRNSVFYRNLKAS